MSRAIKSSVVVGISAIINTLLFMLIYHLVTNEIINLPKYELLNFIDFVEIRKSPENKTDKERELKPEEPPPPETPPELPVQQTTEVPKPAQAKMPLPSARIDIPLGISGIPYIGDFMKPSSSDISPGMPDIATNVVPIKKIEPVYPTRAQRAGIEGTVTVEFTIDTEGNVKEIEVVNAEPPDIFDQAVIQAIRKWKFPPETRGGKAVEMRARQEIRFSLQRR